MNYPPGQQLPSNQPPQGPQRPSWMQNRNIIVLLGGAVALLLVVLLVLVIALVSKDDGPAETAAAGATTTAAPTRGSTAATSSVPAGAGLTIDNRKHMSQAFFKTGATKTGLKLVIVRSVQLPGEFVPLNQDAGGESVYVNLFQRATRDLIVTIGGSKLDDGVAIVSRDLAVRSIPADDKSSLGGDFPQALESNPNAGYWHVEAGGGESIPELAKGIESDQVRLWVAKGDAWDRDKAWIIMYGSSKLYETKLEWA